MRTFRIFGLFASLALGSLTSTALSGGPITVSPTGVITSGTTRLLAISGTSPNGTSWDSLVTGTNPVAYFDLSTGSLMFDPKGRNVNLVDFRWGTVGTISSTEPGPYVFNAATTGTGQGAVSSDTVERVLPAGGWSAVTTFPARLAANISFINVGTLNTSGSNIASTSGWFNQPWSFGSIAPTVTQEEMFSTVAGQGFRSLTAGGDLLGFGSGIGMFLYVQNPSLRSQYGAIVPVDLSARIQLTWAGGSGEWGPSSTNWIGIDGLSVWQAQGQAVFGGTTTGNTVTVTTGGINVGRGMIFTADGYTVTGGGGSTINLTGVHASNNGIFVDTGLTATIDAPLVASAGLAKTGVGTLVIGGAVSGRLNVEAGTLAVGLGATTGSIAGDIANNGTVVFNRSDSVSFGGTISGTGALIQAGAGTLTLTGSSSFTGAMTISGGTLAVGNPSAIGSAGTISFTGGALRFTAVNTTDYSPRFSQAASQSYRLDTNGQGVTLASALVSQGGTLTKLGPGTLSLTGSNSFTGPTTVEVGVLSIGDGGATGSVAGEIAVMLGAALVFNRSDDLTYAGVISGAGGVTKLGPGTLVLAGSNSFSGSMRAVAGALALENTRALAGSTLDLAAGDTGEVVFTAAGTATYAIGGLQGSRHLAIGIHSLSVGGNNASTTYSGGIAGSGGLTKTGVGSLSLTGSHAYTGLTTVTGGTLSIGAGGVTGSIAGDVVVAGGAALAFHRSDALKYGGAMSGPGSVTKLGPGTLTLSGSNSHTGGTAIVGGTLAVGQGGTTGSIAGDIANNGTLVFSRSGSVSFGGTISGTGALIQAGPGTLTLAGSNSFTGATTIEEGTLQVSNVAALASSPVIVERGGVLRADARGTVQLSSLTLEGGGQAMLPTATRQVVALGALSIDHAGGGRLDIGRGRVEIASGGISEADLRADLLAGRTAAGTFSGTSGIVTSAPNPVPFIVPAIGYIVLPSGTTVVAWSAFGDTNLNGRVDFDDILGFVSAGKYDTGAPATWAEGDFDYNGVYDFDDVRAFVATGLYDKGSYLPGPRGLAALDVGALMAVPEPSALGLALAGLGGCVGYSMRRRRSRS